MIKELKKKPTEDLVEYKFRVCEFAKQNNIPWVDLAGIITEETGIVHSKQSLSKWYNPFKSGYLFSKREDPEGDKEYKVSDPQEKRLPNYKQKIEYKSDGSYESDLLLEMSKADAKDVDYLLKAHGFETDGTWRLVNFRNNIWNVYSKKDGVQQLYSSKIVVAPADIPHFKPEWVKEVMESLKDEMLKAVPKTYIYRNKGFIAEVNNADVHIGKFVTELVANGVYDTDSAIKRYEDAIDKQISLMKMFDIKKILFPIGQDFLNIDNIIGGTTKGTRQDMHDFYEAIYKKAYACLIRTIEKLREVAPVDAFYVKGNHDAQSSFSMCQGLEEMYKMLSSLGHDVKVTVDSSPRQRKYKAFKNVLLGFGHGEQEKNNIFNCMQVDAKRDWHKDYKYFHLNHYHKESTKEVGGVIYEWLGAMSENCRWTYSSGFVGSEKKGYLFLYDEEYGKFAEFPVRT